MHPPLNVAGAIPIHTSHDWQRENRSSSRFTKPYTAHTAHTIISSTETLSAPCRPSSVVTHHDPWIWARLPSCCLFCNAPSPPPKNKQKHSPPKNLCCRVATILDELYYTILYYTILYSRSAAESPLLRLPTVPYSCHPGQYQW